MNVRKIRSYEDDFHLAEFAEQAQQIYIDVHRALAEWVGLVQAILGRSCSTLPRNHGG